jgi:signal transduction histidine kinase
MTRRLVVTYFTITAFALASLAIPLGITFAHREKDRLLFAIESDADAIASTAQASGTQAKAPPADAILRYAAQTGGHVIVVDRTGVALLDTDHPHGPARDYSSRPEVIAALAGERANGRRHSSTLGTGLIYSAVPITGSGDLGIRGAVRITYPSATLDARVRRMWSQLALLCLLVLTVVMIVGWVLARSVTRPVRRLEDAANRVAHGDLSTRVPEHGGPPELQHLERAFNQMASEIARLLAAQQQFVADASHQLRTPLTALRLRLENLDAKVNAAERPSVEAIIADLSRLSRLVDGLLMLARDDGGDLGSEVVDVSAVARVRAEAWADVMTDRGVRLVVDAPAPTWATVASGGVEQIVDNLVDNALAVSRAGDTITLRVESHDRPGRTELHVVDEGPGLEPRDRQRAFDRFWRAPDAPSGGSGLGLAIVARLAEVSGGSAALEAGPGGGIDAVVRLPRSRATPEDATERATAVR